MATTNANVILKALIDGAVTELMVKTLGGQVYLDETTTVSAKIAEMVTAINARAKTTDMNTAIATEIDKLRQELLGDTPVEAYNTFTELANYISTHEEAATALTAAIGNKADKTTVEALQATISALGDLASKSKVSETDLDDALKEKVNAASEGNHSHSNKSVLDGITSTKVSNWDDAATAKHTHNNKSVLDDISSSKVSSWDNAATNSHTHANKDVIDGITAEKVAIWDGFTGVRIGSSQPADLKIGELFIQTM